MITVAAVTKTFGGRKLFEDVNTTFAPGNRYGLTGPNGSGKSTFMRIVAGVIEPDEGTVRKPARTSVLEQDHGVFNDDSVRNTVITGNAALWRAMQERDALYLQSETEFTDEMGMRLAELEVVIAEEDGYTAEAQAEALLSGLGIGDELHELPIGELSGGQKVRVLLARALFGKPDAMLLDEPTNHLDLDTIEWLEDFLCRYRGTLLIISHDRRFLNRICTHIADIDYETIITYPGGYDDMVRTKAQIHGRVEREHEQKQRKIAHLNEFIQRFSAGSRASQVQSRRKRLERLKQSDIRRSNIQRPYIRFPVGEESGRHIIDIRELSKGFAGQLLWSGFRAHVNRGERVGIIGRDGAGKTTLLKVLRGEHEAGEGSYEWSDGVRAAYLPQEHEGSIEPGHTIDRWLHGFKPGADFEVIRALLGRMLFRGDEGTKPTATLSGGERVRMLMCKMMLEEPNTLILDEPTNHLDLESIAALSEGLAAYEGTLFVVTHDRAMLDEACTRIWHVADGEILDFRGTYAEFEERYGS